ncbi:hypothetical protein [Paenibacillus flagellatus]|uniref:Uncharacterized protein n=1 Tax=Paenibacillus flagellatus TaxID=2211139 RepID=A0A2V5KL51_9BACL|nr:hypothetical protein [Paenibacillus flagellatus]PYI55660.1 hypothetical protein DLM86_07990 [Paenibacillus flagellatus]
MTAIAVEKLISEAVARPELLEMLAKQPERVGQELGFGSAQLEALKSADRQTDRPMYPVTFTTGTTIEA